MEKIFETLDENYIEFENNKIDIVVDNNEEFWFNAKQTTLALGYSDTKDAIKRHVEKEDTIQLKKINYDKEMISHPNSLYLNEAGLYSLILTSKMPKAKKFKHWITHDILPSIRKYGHYKLKQQYKNDTMDIIKDINTIKSKYEKLKSHLKKEKYPRGGLVYVIDYSDDNEEIYRIGITDNMKKRKQVYNTHTLYNHDVVFFQKSLCLKGLEDCVRGILRNYRYKNQKDFYVCSLEKIKKIIKICNKSINCINDTKNNQSGGSKTNKKIYIRTDLDKMIDDLVHKKFILNKKINKINNLLKK